MADKNNEIEKEIREQIRRAKMPRPEGSVKRGLLLALVLVVVLGAVWVASYQDVAGMDGMRRLFTYNKAKDDGRMELFRYDSDRTATYDMLGDSLIMASTTRLQQ